MYRSRLMYDPNPEAGAGADSTSSPQGAAITRTVKVNGADRVLTIDELVVAAQKALGGEDKFQKAAHLKAQAEEETKRAEAALALRESLSKAIEGDRGAWEETFRALGYDEAQIKEAMSTRFGDDDGGAPAEGGVPDEVTRVIQNLQAEVNALKAKKPTLEDLPPDAKEHFLTAERARITKIVEDALDKDPVLGKNMKRGSAREAILKLALSATKGRLIAQKTKFGDGAHVLPHVIAELRPFVEALGTPSGSTPSGMGPAAGQGDLAVYPATRPDKRVSPSDPGYAEYLAQSMAAEVAEGL